MCQVAYHEIIDVDLDEDCDDVVFLDGNFESNKKAKVGMGTSLGSSKNVASNKKGKEVQVDPGHSLNGFNPGSNNFFDLDDYVFDDEYGTLQSHFNDKGLSTGIPFVTSNAQFEASVSQPNRVDPMPASTVFSSSKKSTPVRGRSTYFTQISSHKAHNYLSNNSYTLNDMLLDQDATVNGSSSKRSRSVKSSSRKAKPVDDDVKNKYESFKRFDSVADHSGHHYARQSSASAQASLFPPKNWAKKIQEEWKILEKDLPDTIFVRVYESRMDLLRAVIIGAEGTPYHDGLFFFDVFFPSTYPNTPPVSLNAYIIISWSKLQKSSPMYVTYCKLCPLSSIITENVLDVCKPLQVMSFSPN
ncbi:putative ubiquitin-conjugating enzyme E2, ubiquitin-conjugating enzyme/RWD [Helianthus annuus]|nr:putative ubiquitin-conjugating enzyme E2, ubiquitin-conjugating enzyme/RWD [Helianthus annuus]